MFRGTRPSGYVVLEEILSKCLKLSLMFRVEAVIIHGYVQNMLQSDELQKFSISTVEMLAPWKSYRDMTKGKTTPKRKQLANIDTLTKRILTFRTYRDYFLSLRRRTQDVV